jgi:predicted ABC-type ATPase
MIYLFLEKPETNITRVAHRVLNGGHHVPKDDIIRRFYRSKEMFMFVYKDLVDKWIMYYNSDEINEKIATDKMIYDDRKWQEFIKDIA